jgi:cytoskeleton-associated protein 5
MFCVTTECLEELGILVRDNGMVICGPQPQKTVPLIASQISDRDNAVRSAALNTMVVVYGNVGDTVFKFTSKVSKNIIMSRVYIHIMTTNI